MGACLPGKIPRNRLHILLAEISAFAFGPLGGDQDGLVAHAGGVPAGAVTFAPDENRILIAMEGGG